MELKADLSKPCRARLLRGVGKTTRRGAADESDLRYSIGDSGSMPSPKTTVGGRSTCQAAAGKLWGRTGASSPIAAFASDAPFETAQLSRRRAAAFSYRVRGFA